MKRFMHTIIESIYIGHPGNSIAENNKNSKETSYYLLHYKPPIFLRKRLPLNLNTAFDNQAFLGGNAIFIEPNQTLTKARQIGITFVFLLVLAMLTSRHKNEQR